MNKIRVEQFLSEFGRWAANQTHIQAVVLVGSYARGTATETSDLDLVVVTNHPDLYLQERGWVETFGGVVSQQIEDYGKLISLRVQYVDKLEVEYGLTDERWLAFPLDEGTSKVISDGIKVLFERKPLLTSECISNLT